MADNTTLNTFCGNCGNLLDKNIGPINTKVGQFKYQCKNCFEVTNGVKCKYTDNFNIECPICFNDKKIWIIFDKCQHYLCYGCFDKIINNMIDEKYSKLSYNDKLDEKFKPQEINCPFCREKIIINNSYLIGTITGYNRIEFKNDEFTIIPDKLKIYFMKIFAYFLFTFNKETQKYNKVERSYIKLYVEEYYKWLLIVSNKTLAPNGANDVSPSSPIDDMWHHHILDTKNYEIVCKEIAGEFIHHFPENAFDMYKEQYEKRIQNTEKIYKLMFLNDIYKYDKNNKKTNYKYMNYLMDLWKFNNFINEKELLQKFNGNTITLIVQHPFYNSFKHEIIAKDDINILTLMFIISKKFGQSFTIIFNNKSICQSSYYFSNFEDNLNKSIKDFGIIDKSKLYVKQDLRGC